jgi:hypothetical protein
MESVMEGKSGSQQYGNCLWMNISQQKHRSHDRIN